MCGSGTAIDLRQLSRRPLTIRQLDGTAILQQANTSTKAKLKVHAVEVHDENGRHVRTHLMSGGKYWPKGTKCGSHPVHGMSGRNGVITHVKMVVT